MDVSQLSSAYMNIGTTGLIVVGFFGLLIYVMKNNNAREEKLYTLIDSLATQIPEMRESLEAIKDGVKELRNKIK